MENLGVSVLSGALTTLGAAFFMIFAHIQFFLQFGTFLLCIIGFSLLFSLVLFVTILGLAGPQNNTGSLIPLFIWIRNKITGRKSTDVKCPQCTGKGFVPAGKGDETGEQQATGELDHSDMDMKGADTINTKNSLSNRNSTDQSSTVFDVKL